MPVSINVNPGFEGGTAGWTPQNAALEQSTEQTHSGTYSGKLTCSSTNQARLSSDFMPVASGAAYKLTAWYYSLAEIPLWLTADWLQADNAFIRHDTTNSHQVATVGAWTLLKLNFHAPANAAQAWFSMRMTPQAGNVLYFDDLTFAAHRDLDLSIADARGRAQAAVAAASPGPTVGAGHTGLAAGPGRTSRGE
ncbi:MAG: carbohydrate binding domain-containing protein [Streptosporangiales bacterium]